MRKLFSLIVVLLCLFIPVAAGAVSLTLGWGAPAAQNPPVTVDGYRLYESSTAGSYTYGSANAIWSGTALTATVNRTIPFGATRYYVVTAYNTAGESVPSNEVSYVMSAMPKPEAPTGLHFITTP